MPDISFHRTYQSSRHHRPGASGSRFIKYRSADSVSALVIPGRQQLMQELLTFGGRPGGVWSQAMQGKATCRYYTSLPCLRRGFVCLRRAELLVSAAVGLPAISPDAIRTDVACGQGVYDINMIPSFVDETSSTRTANYLHHYTTIQIHSTHSCNHLGYGDFLLLSLVFISLGYE